jgi:hypothetical protein
MKFRNFLYTKKKDGEKKSYFLLELEANEEYVEGIVLPELEDSEVEDLVKKAFHREVKYREWNAEAQEEGLDVEDFLARHQDLNEERNEIEESIQPYIKKAYRKFLVDRIETVVPSDLQNTQDE